MKKHLLKNAFLSAGLLFGTVGLSQTTVFSYTGLVQTYTVPAGVNSIQFKLSQLEPKVEKEQMR